MSNINDGNNGSIGIEIPTKKNVEIVRITLYPSTP
jgi:hypothetical protein